MAAPTHTRNDLPPSYNEAATARYPSHGPPSYMQTTPNQGQLPPSFYSNQKQLEACAKPYPVTANSDSVARPQIATTASRPVIIAVDPEAIRKAQDEAFRRRCAIWGAIIAVKVVVAIIVVSVLMS